MTTLAGAYAQQTATADDPGAAEDDFYDCLLRLQDEVIAGRHAKVVLPAGAIQRLKTSRLFLEGTDARMVEHGSADVHAQNMRSSQTNAVTSQDIALDGLSGVRSPPASTTEVVLTAVSSSKLASSGLDPIFLEKSESLVKAESRLKRQRIEKDLISEVYKGTEYGSLQKDATKGRVPSLNVDTLLATAQERFSNVSVTKPAVKVVASVASSFDENDYYSSLVESEWSPDAASAKGSDHHLDSFTADFEPLQQSGPAPVAKDGGKITLLSNSGVFNRADTSPASSRPPSRGQEPNGVDEADDEDEDYSPPEPTTFDSLYNGDTRMNMLGDNAEDDSDYEPGEITQAPTNGIYPQNGNPQALQYQEAPTYRSHLTHIAAPQPNRVSPLAVQKGPSIELELVNGRPELVHKGKRRQQPVASRVSSTSPAATATGPSQPLARRSDRVKKAKPVEPHKGKKRKRAPEQQNSARKRPERIERYRHQSPPSPNGPESPYKATFIKPEPISPPRTRIEDVPVLPGYGHRLSNAHQPIEIDLGSPKHAPSQRQYAPASLTPHGYPAPPTHPVAYRAVSSSGHRPTQRDTQDLRRVASLHYAQRPATPPRDFYSPVAPYHATAQRTIESRQPSVAPVAQQVRYVDARPVQHHATFDPQPQPVLTQPYRESSPGMMPPPAVPPRQIVVDQYGRQFYAAEPVPLAAPFSRQPDAEQMYERAPSRMSVMPALPPPLKAYYDIADARMAPSFQPARRQLQQEAPVEYVDANSYPPREQSVRYSAAPTSPVYQQNPQYEPMAPPPPVRQSYREYQHQSMGPPQPLPLPPQTTSPVYAAPPRAYSVRPDAYEPTVPQYLPRQASVAPVQYVRQDLPPPVRAASIMPGNEYGAPVYQQRGPAYGAPPPVRYVDEYGRELVQQDVGQGSQHR